MPARTALETACAPGRDSQLPGDENYPGGLSVRGGGLTPQHIPGATTVSAREAKCIIDRFGAKVLVLAAMNDGDMLPGAIDASVAHLYRSAVEHHTARHDMAKLARTDALTGLSNRLLLREQFQDRAAAAVRAKNLVALHYLDLDGFKDVNDRYGHPAGDALLEQVARRLEEIVRADDVVARLGGDEFIVLQAGIGEESEAEMLARRIIREVSKPYVIDDISMSVSVSVGIATAPKLGLELERLLGCADAALYRAKAGGKARALFCIEADAADAEMAA